MDDHVCQYPCPQHDTALWEAMNRALAREADRMWQELMYSHASRACTREGDR